MHGERPAGRRHRRAGAAYPPALAQDWDSVGLVCGDPDEVVDSVTIAVDATAAVVAEVPDRGLLLAHHPLLLRGVDTVAASTAKGALLHRLIRAGSALFTAHTNADSASPGVSDALADALGLTVEDVLSPVAGRAGLDKWVVFVPVGRTPMRCARRCSPRAPGTSATTRTAAGASRAPASSCRTTGASPAIGTVGTVEQVAEDRVEMIAPARLRGRVLAALRAAHPYEEPAFDVLALAPLPPTSASAGSVRCRRRRPLSAFVSRVHAALPAHVVGGAGGGRSRRRGVAGGGVRRGGRLAARRRRRRRACRPT